MKQNSETLKKLKRLLEDYQEARSKSRENDRTSRDFEPGEKMNAARDALLAFVEEMRLPTSAKLQLALLADAWKILSYETSESVSILSPRYREINYGETQAYHTLVRRISGKRKC